MRTDIKAACAAAWISFAGLAHAFSVFVCEPEWGALVKVLHPDAQIYSATTHLQDPHHVEARPSLIARLRQADLAVCTGASLEAGWLPTLQARSGNAKVQDGQPGMLYASQFVKLIGQYDGTVTPFSGDVHPEGNPHFHVDPRRLLQIAAGLRDRLIQLLPLQADAIRDRHARFEYSLTEAISLWETNAAGLRGQPIITQHTSFGYLWEWLKMKSVADLEPKPGMAPTPGHLERLRTQVAAGSVRAIVIAEHHDKRPAQWLVRQAGPLQPPLIILPATVTKISETALIDWLDELISTITQRIQ